MNLPKPPPRYVPTLTQMVTNSSARGAPTRASLEAAQPAATAAPQPTAEDLAQLLRQQLLVRTRRYMDIELQRRIRETVSQLALEHAYKLFEEIQPHLEATITQVVDEAIQQAIGHAAKQSGLNNP